MNQEAVIIERSYRRYEDERLGKWAILRAIVRESFRQVLGLRRSARRKIFPWSLIILVGLVVAVLIGVQWAASRAAGPLDPELPTYGELFDITSVITLMFMATAAPRLLGPDRTEKVLSVYMSRPLRIGDYLIAKSAALFAVGMAFLVVPQIILHLGLAALSSDGFTRYLTGNLDVLWQVPAAAVVYTVTMGSAAMAVAALIPRIGFAAAIYLGGLMISNGVTEVVRCLDFPGSRFGAFLAIEQYPRVVRDWIFDIRTAGYFLRIEGFQPWVALLAGVVLALVCGSFVWLRYRKTT